MRKLNIYNAVLLVMIFLCLIALDAKSQMLKGKYGTFALTNATIETVTQGIIDRGTVLISKGSIVAVGADVSVPPEAEVIDCTGLWVYPGMIDGGTRLGLSEVGSDPRTQDHQELGEVVPQMNALTAINPSSAHIPVARINGITSALTGPSGGLFPGTAAFINLYGYTSDQLYAGFQAVVLNFPSTSRKSHYDRRTDEEIKASMTKAMDQLNDVWEKAVQYYQIDSAMRGSALPYYPEMHALLQVIRGNTTLMIEVNKAEDILSALKWIKEKNIKKAILTGVKEGWRVAPQIASAGIPVITGPVISLPSREYDRYDKCYANAGLMRKAGVKVALRTSSAENVRNLPYQAGFAVAYGMPREEALKAVTIVPAEIFGVADQLGSIESGKKANLFVCDGDPFETKTQIKYLFIDGWQIPLVSRHTMLYDEYLKREPGIEKIKVVEK